MRLVLGRWFGPHRGTTANRSLCCGKWTEMWCLCTTNLAQLVRSPWLKENSSRDNLDVVFHYERILTNVAPGTQTGNIHEISCSSWALVSSQRKRISLPEPGAAPFLLLSTGYQIGRCNIINSFSCAFNLTANSSDLPTA